MDTKPPAQNRVSPLGEVIAAPGRGAWMGNRGRLHEGSGTRVTVRPFQSRAWITCRLEFRGWHAAQWDAHHYTPLFFLDEAVALAAGHRPCAECRHADYVAFRDLAARAAGVERLSAHDLDGRMHVERWDAHRRAHPVHDEPWDRLPDGVFALVDGAPVLVHGDRIVPWSTDNRYGEALERPRRGTAAVVTPQLTVAVLRAGYPVQMGDPSPDVDP